MNIIKIKKSDFQEYITMWGEFCKKDRVYLEIVNNTRDYYIIYKNNLPYCDFSINKNDNELWWRDLKEDIYSNLKETLVSYKSLYITVEEGQRSERMTNLLLSNKYKITQTIKDNKYVKIYFEVN